MTSSRREPQTVKRGISQQPLVKFETVAFGIKPECTKVSNEDDLQRKRTSKYEKWNISETTAWILLKFENKSI